MEVVRKAYKYQVVSHVYQHLLAGASGPADQVKESLLAEQMGISRAPIREAMKELIMNGLVDYRPQVGNFVPVLSPKQIVGSYTTRGILEGYADMETCGLFSTEEIEKLGSLTALMESYAQKKNHKLVVETDGEFHGLLISKGSNVQLLEYTDRLSLKLHILFCKYWGRLYTSAEIGERHRAIVESIQAQDLALIEKVIRQHYVGTGTKIAEF